MKCKDCKAYYCEYRTTDAEKDCYYEQLIAKEFDWKSFRAEASKDILCALIASSTINIGVKEVASSIKLADELIKQLKEKEDK